MSEPIDRFFAAHDWPLLERVSGWRVVRDEKDPDRVLLTLKARDGEAYTVLFLCNGYPENAPSVAFVDPQGSKANPRAWPDGNARFYEEVKAPPDSFLCMPLTREGLAHHDNWRTTPEANPWDPRVHTLMDLFNRVQRVLNSPDYSGRRSA